MIPKAIRNHTPIILQRSSKILTNLLHTIQKCRYRETILESKKIKKLSLACADIDHKVIID